MKKALLSVVCLVFIAACGGGGGAGTQSAAGNSQVGSLRNIAAPAAGISFMNSGTPDSSAGPANVRFLLTDAPNSQIDSAVVTIGGMTVHKTGGAFFSVFEGEKTLDLMDLQNGITTILGELSLEPGKYTQIRFAVAGGSVESGGTKYDVVIPSGEIKLNRNIDVCSGGSIDIVLDFDAAQSLKYNKGQNVYKMSPVVKIASVTSNCPAATGDAGGGATEYSGPTGWLSVVIPPLPLEKIDYTLGTTVNDIWVHDQGIGQVSIFKESYAVDLLEPARQIADAGAPLYTVLVPPVKVPAGDLDQVRLLFQQITATDSSGRSIFLKLPPEDNADNDGLKFFGSIKVCEDALTVLQWDIDLSPSGLNFGESDSSITIHPETHDIHLRAVCEPYTP